MTISRTYPNQDHVIARALAGEVICNIGHISPETERKLNKLARDGDLAKWRGHWYPTAGAPWGIGPLKTCWGPHEVRDFFTARRAA